MTPLPSVYVGLSVSEGGDSPTELPDAEWSLTELKPASILLRGAHKVLLRVRRTSCFKSEIFIFTVRLTAGQKAHLGGFWKSTIKSGQEWFAGKLTPSLMVMEPFVWALNILLWKGGYSPLRSESMTKVELWKMIDLISHSGLHHFLSLLLSYEMLKKNTKKDIQYFI